MKKSNDDGHNVCPSRGLVFARGVVMKIMWRMVVALILFVQVGQADDYGNWTWRTQMGTGEYTVRYRWDSVQKRTLVVKEDGTPYRGTVYLRSRFSLTPQEHTKAMLFWEQPENREKQLRYQLAVQAGR